MTPDFDHILAALEGIGVDPTAREAAEALWLATHIAQSATAKAAHPQRPPTQGSDTPGPVTHTDGRTAPVTPAALHASTTGAATTAAGQGSTRAVAVRVADAPALTHELDLLRALRPLKRKVPSRQRVLLDETATAERSAEQRLFLPATHPEPERWLSLALVMETGPTMVVWHSLVRELTALLQRTGAFRDIRLWHLHPAPDGSVGLHPQAVPTSPLHSPREILDPTGRQAIWCVSDCVSVLWQHGRADRLLELWGRAGPLALIQPLPQRLWRRTGLPLEEVRLHSGMPGLPNTRLRTARSGSAALLGEPVTGTPVPVLELDPAWLGLWTRLVTATAPGGVPAVVTTTGHPRDGATLPDGAQAATEDPLGLVRAFRAHASPQAYRLAGFLATVPLTLPVMRLVQRVMLPETRPAHLAEVLLSGLLRRTRQDSVSPEFRFVDGVPEVLRSTVRRSDSRRVHDEVSAYLTAHAGDARDTQAFAVLPSGQGNVTLPAPGPSFGRIDLRDTSVSSGSGPAPGRGESGPLRVRESLVTRIANVVQSSESARHSTPRSLLVSMLETELGVPLVLPEHPLWAWALDLVRTCTEQPDGVGVLVRCLHYVEQESSAVSALRPLLDEWEAVQFFGYADLSLLRPVLDRVRGGTKLTAFARRASRSRVQELPFWCQTGWDVFLRLAGEVTQAGQLPPSMAFLVLAADRMTNEGQTADALLLTRFNRQQASVLGVEVQLADWERPEVSQRTPLRAYRLLLIQVEPDHVDTDGYYFSHWRQADLEGWHPARGDTYRHSREELPGAVRGVVQVTEEQWSDAPEPVNLEFVLPWELLNEPVEWWLKDGEHPSPTPLALDHSVAVRSLERMGRQAWHRRWYTKWRQLTERPERSHAFWSLPGSDDNYLFHLERELKEDGDAVCLVLSAPPGDDPGVGRREALAGLRAGVPMMIWDRRGPMDRAFSDAVAELVEDLRPERIMQRVTKLRHEALTVGPEAWDSHVGRNLVLLLDDPERQPHSPGPV
ncbi:hypothetical protein BN159_0734 [Streptomyces davaonensis JCM 4913]|uniref:Uncharacterized protein n=1 Tax=Streptomyces davaonensis (strain DSM 101723 / JCM 4913 / KCC S-0913 / 768) TaxID=1214101 RepID=K4QVP7_STRDJ|nr:SAV_2336 N-terminal domain-related protein [Streptomyces davaonensis]CCK25113.1 hypothetical protein BN159_0734 [Streptomyces davaonensis JCM 4913]